MISVRPHRPCAVIGQVVVGVLALLATLALSGQAVHAAESEPAAVDNSTSQGTPPWSPCGARDKKTKVLHQYKRATVAGVAGARATLACGTSGWGFRHIKVRHLSQWEAEAAPLFTPWMDIAHWAIANTLATPCSKLRQTRNDTIQYVAPFELRDQRGKIVRSFGVRVVVGRKTQNIITAYPQKATC